jgi:hypothetical protein
MRQMAAQFVINLNGIIKTEMRRPSAEQKNDDK